MTLDRFAQHRTEVGGYGQIAVLVQMIAAQPRPVAVNFAALHPAAEDEHHVGMAVVGAAVAVLFHGAAKLRHSDQQNILLPRSQVGPEGAESGTEAGEVGGQLPLGATFVDVMVPSA